MAVHVTASRTMILLDPELAPPGKSSQETPEKERQGRMPSVRVLSRFLREAQAAVRLRGQVSVLLTTDGEIRRLNRRFRGKNTATDVLSFPAILPSLVSKSGRPGAPASPRVSGDLAISVDTARRQAVEQGHALAIEVRVLMLHGLLHLAGHDHETDDGAMARRERVLRARLGLPLGLIERVSEDGSSRYPTHAAKDRRKDGAPGVEVKGGLRSPALATKRNRKDGARGLKVGQRASRTAGPSTSRSTAVARSAQDDKRQGGRA